MIRGFRLVRLLACVALLLAFGAGAAWAGKSHRTFKNTSAVAANDFKLRTGNKVKNASFKNLSNNNAFLPDQVFDPPVNSWDSPVDNTNPIPADGKMKVCSEGGQATIFSKFTRDNVEIGTKTISMNIVVNQLGPTTFEYVVTNLSASQSIQLTDLTTRKDGNPATLFGPGEYTGGGTVVFSGAGPFAIAPEASQAFSLGSVDISKACSIEFDAALVSEPADKYATLEASGGAKAPGASSLALGLLALAMAVTGAIWIRRRRSPLPAA